MILPRRWILAASGVLSLVVATASVGQPTPNALVPGAIAPYAPERIGPTQTGPAAQATISTPNGPANTGSAAVAGGSPKAAAGYDYVLGAGDKLRMIVFDEEKLSGEFIVAGNGHLSLPLIGDVAASGKTIGQVLSEITTKLAVYLKDPRVSAEVETFRPYFILGEVAHPGEYPYSDGITVLNAIATAGGFTYRADHRYIFLKRGEAASEVRVRLTDSLTLAPGDTIRVRERYF